jgi:hypothetical protein
MIRKTPLFIVCDLLILVSEVPMNNNLLEEIIINRLSIMTLLGIKSGQGNLHHF